MKMSKSIDVRRCNTFIRHMYNELGQLRNEASEISDKNVRMAILERADRSALLLGLFEEEVRKNELFDISKR